MLKTDLSINLESMMLHLNVVLKRAHYVAEHMQKPCLSLYVAYMKNQYPVTVRQCDPTSQVCMAAPRLKPSLPRNNQFPASLRSPQHHFLGTCLL